MLRSIIYLKSKGFGATANWERPLHVFYRHAYCQHYHKLLRLSLRSPTFSDPLGARDIPGGNFTGYCDFCFNLGEQYLKQYMLKKRG